MSRIHEALKRAEQERVASQAGTAPHEFPTLPADPLLRLEDGPTSATPVNLDAATPPALAVPGSPEAVLARCPLLPWKPDPATMLFVNGNDGMPGAEEYRTLRSRLYHLREKMTLKTVLVTSALPKEGKSFTAANLAQVLARQHGRRVLLIDGDLRGPRLHAMMGTTMGPGLSDYLQRKNDEFSIMQRGPMANLFLIPSGSNIEDPAELIGNGRLKILVQRVEALFDWIVIDSPPAVPVSDASVLSKACDGVLMVVRANATPSDMAQKARMEFPEPALVGVVLNGRRADDVPYERYYYGAYEKKSNGFKTQGE
jgi:protein-tyrosine kinase